MILSWFLNQTLSAGDWPYLYRENIFELPFPPKWPFSWLTPFYQLTAKLLVQYLGLSWEATERLVWFWPFWILTAVSSWFLAKTVFPKEKIAQFLSPPIFLFNSYILMVVGGGQIGVAIAYSLAPLVLGLFIGLSRPILAGLILAAQLMFDPRITLITLLAVAIWGAISRSDLKRLILPMVLGLILNSFWLLPTIFYGPAFAPAGFTLPEGFKFLSIADFPHAFSLLHPNWPENIFGKVGLMRPEFLVLPILAFSALLFINYSRVNELTSLKIKKVSNSLIINSLIENKVILYFSLLALMGAFLAKGVNPPAGWINLWLFEHIPGFNLFRDPTKFYALVALSYSVLIPFSISEIYRRLGMVSKIFLLLVISYLLFLVRPLGLGELGGTFKSRPVPKEYVALKDFFVNDQQFGKVLWLPRRQRFGFQSNNHPAVELEQFIADEKCLEPFCQLKVADLNRDYFKCFPTEHCFPADASFLANPRLPSALAYLSIKYLVIPYDSEGEIFLRERAYDEPSRQKLVDFVKGLNYLRPVNLGSKISVYEVLK